MALLSKPDILKMEKMQNATPRQVYWATLQMDRFRKVIIRKLNSRSHNAYKRVYEIVNLIRELDNEKLFTNQFLPGINAKPDYIKDKVLREAIKKDMLKLKLDLNKSLPELKFLEDMADRVSKTEVENIDTIKNDIEGELIRTYGDTRLVNKLRKVSEKNALAESALLKSLERELSSRNIEPKRLGEYVGIIRQRNDARLANSIDKLKYDFPAPNAGDNLRGLLKRIKPDGSNFLDFVNQYISNPTQIRAEIIDQKTQGKVAEAIRKIYALSYLRHLTRELARGNWDVFLKYFDDIKGFRQLVAKFENGSRLALQDLPASHWMVGKIIRDADIARFLANNEKRRPTIVEWRNLLIRFVSRREYYLGIEFRNFITARITEMEKAFNEVHGLVKRRIEGLDKTERRIKQNLANAFLKRKKSIENYINNIRKLLLSDAKTRMNVLSEEIRDMRALLETNLEGAYQILFSYWLKTIEIWEKGAKKSRIKKLDKTRDELVNVVYNITQKYKDWYEKEGLLM